MEIESKSGSSDDSGFVKGWHSLVQTRSGQQFVCKEVTGTLKPGWLTLIPTGNESKISFSGPLSEHAFWVRLNVVEIREDAVDWVGFGYGD